MLAQVGMHARFVGDLLDIMMILCLGTWRLVHARAEWPRAAWEGNQPAGTRLSIDAFQTTPAATLCAF